ncbi:MAG: signal peptidase I [Oscillospiraceae bacterium]
MIYFMQKIFTIKKKVTIKKQQMRIIRRVFCVILIILLSFYVSQNYFQLAIIQGKSMSPTYHNFQFVLLDVRKKQPSVGDVVAFWSDETKSVLIKRVAACPGDTIQIKDGVLYLNKENSKQYDQVYFDYAGIAASPLELGEDEYFVIGDNIKESKDSRYEQIGVISGSEIRGCVV